MDVFKWKLILHFRLICQQQFLCAGQIDLEIQISFFSPFSLKTSSRSPTTIFLFLYLTIVGNSCLLEGLKLEKRRDVQNDEKLKTSQGSQIPLQSARTLGSKDVCFESSNLRYCCACAFHYAFSHQLLLLFLFVYLVWVDLWRAVFCV